MSQNQLRFDGLAELRAALRNLPASLTTEASRIVEGAANGAAAQVRGQMPAGDARNGVTVTHFERGKFSAGAIVKNRWPLAYLWDNGSQLRHYITVRGKRHPTGKMWGRQSPPHTFIRAMVRARRLMYSQLKDLLERNGLKVSGHE